MAVDNITDLAAEIQGLVEKETLSGKGVQAFQKAIERVAALEKELSGAIDMADKLRKEKSMAEEQVRALGARLTAWEQRESAIVTREKHMTELEKKEAVQTAIASTWANAFDKVFRNIETRQQVFSSHPVARNSGDYVSSEPGSTEVTSTKG